MCFQIGIRSSHSYLEVQKVLENGLIIGLLTLFKDQLLHLNNALII